MDSKINNTTTIAHLLTWNYGYTRKQLWKFHEVYGPRFDMGTIDTLRKVIVREKLPKNTPARAHQAGSIEALSSTMDASQVCAVWSISPLLIINAQRENAYFWWTTVDEAINLYYFIDLISPQGLIDELDEYVESGRRYEREAALALFRVSDDLRQEALQHGTGLDEDASDPARKKDVADG